MNSGFNVGLVLWTLVPFVLLGSVVFLGWRVVRALERGKGDTGSTDSSSSQKRNHA